jgi:hypothetical protein
MIAEPVNIPKIGTRVSGLSAPMHLGLKRNRPFVPNIPKTAVLRILK